MSDTNAGPTSEVKIVGYYPLFGDAEGRDWMDTVLRQAMANKVIRDYAVLGVFPGPVGLQMVLFSVDANISVEAPAQTRGRMYSLASVTCSDTDDYETTTASKFEVKNRQLHTNAGRLLNDLVADTDAKVLWLTYP